MYSPTALITTGVVLPILAVATVCIRYWVRLRVSPTYVGADDILIAVGTLFVCAMGAIQVGSTIQGTTSEETKSTPAREYVGDKYNYAMVVVEKVAYGTIKLSVLFFYRRIFGVHDRFRMFNNILIVLTTLWAVAFLFANIFICGTHVDIQWKDRKGAGQYCGDVGTSDLWFAITDVVGDALIVSMPFFIIRKLKMSSREKWAVSIVFLLAVLSTIAGALRLSFIAVSYSYGQMGWNPPPPPDPEPHILKVVNALFWTLVEVTFGVVAACLPPLGPLLRRSPNPRSLLSSARRKMSLSSHSHGSSNRKGSHPWDRARTLLNSGRSEKGDGDSQVTFVDGANAWGKKSEESAPAIPNEDICLSSMQASGMWNDARDRHIGDDAV